MTIKELKAKIKDVSDEMEVLILTDTEHGEFVFSEPKADIVGMPENEYSDKTTDVFVLAWPELLPDDEPKLALVKEEKRK